MTSRRGLALGLTLACLALLAALITPLALLSGVTALEANYAADGLPHRIAGDSLVGVLPQLVRDGRVQAALDRENRWLFETVVGATHVQVLVQDDSAKLPLQALWDGADPRLLTAALQRLAPPGLEPLGLRAHAPTAAPWSGCLEELFEDADDAGLYGRPSGDAWTRHVTPIGRRINVQRATAATCAALFDEIQPGLATRFTERNGEAPDLHDLRAPDRERALALITNRPERYSLLIRTTLNGQSRQRYVIIDAGSAPQVLLDWEVAP